MTAEAQRRPPRVGILVFDGVEELDFVGPWVTAQNP